MEIEVWYRVLELDNYELSSWGRTRKLGKGHKDVAGFWRVSLPTKDKKLAHPKLHDALWAAAHQISIKDCPKLIHKDGDRSNNHLSNLATPEQFKMELDVRARMEALERAQENSLNTQNGPPI